MLYEIPYFTVVGRVTVPGRLKVTSSASPLKQVLRPEEYQRPSPHFTLAEGRYRTANVCVMDARTLLLASDRVSVIGSENVAPVGVAQLPAVQLPVTHAQLLRVTI